MVCHLCPAQAGSSSGDFARELDQTPSVAAKALDPGGRKQAEVEYVGGLLRVRANNSSLNQLVREIGRQTGMKITGRVQDDRVFGNYGPRPASQVLTTLLDGTGSNVLIVDNGQGGPAELILTPRRGSATPPNPNSANAEDNDPVPPTQQQSFPQAVQGNVQSGQGISVTPVGGSGLPPSNGGQTGTPISGGANLGAVPGAFAGYGQTAPDATAQPSGTQPAGEQASPNGVSTPQQIYEQLQRLRQQQPSTTTPR